MRFHSKFLDHEPFSTLNAKIALKKAKSLAERAEAKLQKRLVSPDRLMYDYNTQRLLDAQTKNPYNGKTIISGDKFERVIHVKDGKEVANLVRLKDGQKYYAERNGKGRYFNTVLPEQETEVQVQKMLEADQKIYDQMMDSFEKSK